MAADRVQQVQEDDATARVTTHTSTRADVIPSKLKEGWSKRITSPATLTLAGAGVCVVLGLVACANISKRMYMNFASTNKH